MTALKSALPGLERNAVVAASAGTGKTHLITNIYLSHVLGLRSDRRQVPAERIVATTFSRAAAREIRERLELRLGIIAGEIAKSEGIGLDAQLIARVEELGLEPSVVATRASHALGELPRTLIDTLHGLAARVLRMHALELGLAPSFDILDEQQAIEDATTTVEDVLSRALGQGPARERVVHALLEAGNGLESGVFSALSLLSLLDEEGLDASELALGEHARDAEALRATLLDAAQAVLSSSVSHPLRAPASALRDALGAGNRASLIDALAELLRDNRPKIAKMEQGARVLEALDALPSGSSKAEKIRRAASFLANARSLDIEARGIAELLSEMQVELRTRRRARAALGFGDVLRLARDALRDHPELAARSAEGIELLLVDEFQDTSRVQRDLVFLLRERPESARRRKPHTLPEARHLSERGLVVVGDRKQSIYAFRGADVSVYARLAAELAGSAAVEALDLHGVGPIDEGVADLVTLTDNYRSRSAILGFVNRVAERDFSPAPQRSFEIRYMASEALRSPPRPEPDAGRVTVLRDDGGAPDDAEPLIASADGVLRTAAIVAGFCAQARAEGNEFRDIALLARRRSTLPLVELAFDRLQIPFVVAGRALYATPEVRDLAALLRLALDPYDRHALATVARGPLGGLSDRALAELAQPGRGLSPAARWSEKPPSGSRDAALAEELAERLAELAQVGPRLSPRDALAFAVDRFELEAVLAALPRGAVRFGNVGRLMEIAARRGGSLPQFVRWLNRQIALDVDESEAATFSEEDDAVRLLTIHGSKGLSFPITVVVDLGATEAGRHPPLALLRDEDGRTTLFMRHHGAEGVISTPLGARFNDDVRARAQAERQRLSYVALTRAERELVLAMPPANAARSGSLAATLASLLGDASFVEECGARVLDARDLLSAKPVVSATSTEPVNVPQRPASAPWQEAAIGVTALGDFALCPRRFQLLHVFGLSELGAPRTSNGDAADEARLIGSAAHRVLERFPLERWGESFDVSELELALAAEGLTAGAQETRSTAEGMRAFLAGSYAREVRESGARLHRELELTLVISHQEPAPRARRQLELFAPRPSAEPAMKRAVLRATLDLVVERADGSLDVIDYKRSRGGNAARYALQLGAYRAAVQQHFGLRTVRTGLVHLLAVDEQPDWIEAPSVDLGQLVSELVEHRYAGDFKPVDRPRCLVARCGFIQACHPRGQ
jgi:ATP-dependent helicase/nuclease subunit A